MSAPSGQNGVPKRPAWVNYGAAILIQAGLTAFLLWLYPYFPLGKFPAPYAAALLLTVLAFGEGPATLALVLSLASFHYYFVPPMNSWALPRTMEEWTSVVAYILVNGTVVLAVSVIQRGRQRAERLAESLSEHAKILDLAHVLIRDGDDRIIEWNTGLRALYGFSKEEAIGKVSHDLFQTVFPESKEAFIASLAKTGEWQGELVHIAKDGSKIIVASHHVVHKDSSGKGQVVLEVNNDITGRIQAQRALEKALQDLSVANQDIEMMNEELRVSNEELHQEVLQRRQAEDELRKNETLLREVTDGSPDPIFLKDRQSRIVMANPATLEVIGKSADEVIGRTDVEFYDDVAVGKAMMDNDRTIMESGESQDIEESVPGPEGPRVFLSKKVPWRNAEGNVIGLLGIARDITDRKRADQEREMTIEFLQIVNRSGGSAELIRDTATFFQRVSGCEAVGIRLKDGDDYPYYEARGFSNDFVQAENSLCSRDISGCPVRDDQGYPICACMCGNIVQGRFDPSMPFFTEHGSFWTNNTTRLLATSTEDERQARTRNRCNGEGYESVALIPLHVGEERLGLLQLNDRREGVFALETVGLWERFADYLAIALRKFEAEEALRESEERYHTLFDTLIEGFCTVEVIFDADDRPIDYRFLEVNQAFEARTGLSDVPGRLMRDIAPDHEQYWFEIYGRVALTGEPVRFENEAKALGRYYDVCAYRIGDPGSRKVAILFNDITERHLAEEALREADNQKLNFYRQTILAATEGKLVISESGEIEQIAGVPLREWQVNSINDVGDVRVEATAAARQAGMDESRVYDFMACVVESTGNAAKHAGSGRACLYELGGKLLFSVSDSGSGISAMRIPDVALTRGYTTAGTLGMGYKVMISFADKVYLATGPEGTTVACEMALHKKSADPVAIPAGRI